jgi:hypothetical protein
MTYSPAIPPPTIRAEALPCCPPGYAMAEVPVRFPPAPCRPVVHSDVGTIYYALKVGWRCR